MPGKFTPKRDVKRVELESVRLGWVSDLPATGAKQLTVKLSPDASHGPPEST